MYFFFIKCLVTLFFFFVVFIMILRSILLFRIFNQLKYKKTFISIVFIFHSVNINTQIGGCIYVHLTTSLKLEFFCHKELLLKPMPHAMPLLNLSNFVKNTSINVKRLKQDFCSLC